MQLTVNKWIQWSGHRWWQTVCKLNHGKQLRCIFIAQLFPCQTRAFHQAMSDFCSLDYCGCYVWRELTDRKMKMNQFTRENRLASIYCRSSHHYSKLSRITFFNLYIYLFLSLLFFRFFSIRNFAASFETSTLASAQFSHEEVRKLN